MNVAIVVLDTLRKDAFDREFDWLPGRRFSAAYSTGSWTVPAHASLFAGKYPSELGVHSKNRFLDCEEQTLAERLQSEGYTTAAYSCNPYVSSVFDFDRGFEKFEGSWRLRHFDPELFDWKRFISETRDEGPKRYARAVWRCFSEDCRTLPSLHHGMRLKLRKSNLPFGEAEDDGAQSALKYLQSRSFGSKEFLFVNLMEAHSPYAPPSAYRTVDSDERPGLIETVTAAEVRNPQKVRQAYDDCVRYLSDVYEEMFEILSANFDYVITLADHGEMFGERGVWAHCHGVHPELTHIPLTISGNGLSGSESVPTSILDVHRTVLAMAGLVGESRGQDLLADPEQAERLTEYMGLTADDRERFATEGVSGATIDQYDAEFRGLLSSDAGYGYQDIDGFQQDESATATEEGLSTLVSDLDRREVANRDTLSEDLRTHLEDLGYA